MTINWHEPAKPVAPVADQLYVDDKRQIWQWDDTAQSWVRREHMYLQEVEYLSLYTAGRTWFSTIDDVYPLYRGLREWATLYPQTFCEFSFPFTAAPTVYRSHIATLVLLRAVMRSSTPHNGTFNDQCNVRVLQVVDPSLNMEKVSSHNFLYSCLRGREAYNRNKGRGAAGLPHRCGYSWRFQSIPAGPYFSDAFSDPWFQFLEMFHGITPGGPDVDGHKILWHRTQNNLYRQPKEGSMVNSGTPGSRYVWDVNTASVMVSTAYTEYVVGAPKVLNTSFWNPTSRVLQDANCLCSGALMYLQGSAMLVYPLSNADPVTPKYAFFCKPVGVDSFGFGYDPFGTSTMLVVEHVYSKGVIRRFALNPAAASCRGVYDQMDSVTGFDVRAIQLPTEMGLREHDSKFPEFVQFYLYDYATGRRSEITKQKFRLVRHKCHVTMAWEPMVNR